MTRRAWWRAHVAAAAEGNVDRVVAAVVVVTTVPTASINFFLMFHPPKRPPPPPVLGAGAGLAVGLAHSPLGGRCCRGVGEGEGELGPEEEPRSPLGVGDGTRSEGRVMGRFKPSEDRRRPDELRSSDFSGELLEGGSTITTHSSDLTLVDSTERETTSSKVMGWS